eukprot:1588807-Amphidinium_carterae.1
MTRGKDPKAQRARLLATPRAWHCIYPVKKGTRYSAVCYALSSLERLGEAEWNILERCGFNAGFTSDQVIKSVRAAFGELTD